MRSSWVTTFAVGGVILLLTLFLGLQYNWLVQAGSAERERMQRRVEADTRGFADDFNREIQAAYFNFQTDANEWAKADWSEFNQRYDYWRSKTAYPELISDLYFIGKDRPETLRYDAQARTFTAVELPADLVPLRERLNSDERPRPVSRGPLHAGNAGSRRRTGHMKGSCCVASLRGIRPSGSRCLNRKDIF